MNFRLSRKKDYSEKRHTISSSESYGLNSFVAQFFVFHGEKYLGWDCFDKSRVKVGKSQGADLVLSDGNIADIQAEFVIKGDRIIVSDEGGNDCLFVNDKVVSNCIIGPFDFIRIGNYTIKIKLKGIEGQEPEPIQPPTADKKKSKVPGKAGSTTAGGIKPQESDTKSPIDLTGEVKIPAQPGKPSGIQGEEIEFVDIEDVVNDPPPAKKIKTSKERQPDGPGNDVEVEVFEIDPFAGEELKPKKTVEAKKQPVKSGKQSKKPVKPSAEDPGFEISIDEMSSAPPDTIITTNKGSVEPEDSWFMPDSDSDDDSLSWDDFANTRPDVSDDISRLDESEELVISLGDKEPKGKQTVNKPKKAVTPVKTTKRVEPETDKTDTLKSGDETFTVARKKAVSGKKTAAESQPEKTTPDVEKNTFPPGFFNPVIDEEDEEDDDFPADFSLREKLTGTEKQNNRAFTGEKVLEIIKFRNDNVLEVKQLKDNERFILIDEGKTFCQVENSDKEGQNLLFSKPLLGKINVCNGKELATQKKKSVKAVLSRQSTFSSVIPVKGETLVSDGYYDFVMRRTNVTSQPELAGDPAEQLPLHQRVVKSNGFKYTMWAVAFHLILMIVLPLSVIVVDTENMTDPETHFVVIETKNIHKPQKPKPKPKPKAVAPAPKPKAPEKKIAKKKKPPKKSTQVASLRKKNIKKPKKVKPGAPKAGGGHKGNLVNRNVNQVGLLGTLGMKTGIDVKPTAALASVTNMDAVTSTHGREARVKVGGLVGSLGDGKMAIPTGGVLNTKGSTNVLRSAGIGGDGSVAALKSGNTGTRAVAGAVSAPLAKKVRSRGGGISKEAVAKVINEHIDEINYCYETALISDPTLMGKVVFEWKILLSGRVGEVKIKSSSIRSADIHSCIKAAIRTWQFPKPKGAAVVVSYPFVFDVTGF